MNKKHRTMIWHKRESLPIHLMILRMETNVSTENRTNSLLSAFYPIRWGGQLYMQQRRRSKSDEIKKCRATARYRMENKSLVSVKVNEYDRM